MNSSELKVTLRPTVDSDLPIFFEHETDPLSIHMAAFTPENPADRAAFEAHWAKIRANSGILLRTIEVDGAVAGHVVSFVMFDETNISYWLGQEWWGKGIATMALKQFLQVQTARPLFGRAVKDNTRSLRVLQNCGFKQVGEDKGFANGRAAEVEELILRLD